MTATQTATRADVQPDEPVVNGFGYTRRQVLLIMSALMLGMLLAALDQTIVSTALTTITRQFHRVDLYGWVVTAYLLTSTATTPLYGKISDQFGRKRIFQAAIVIFLAGSVLSGVSQNMYQLIIFRAVQGVGSGGLFTVAMAIVGDLIPARDRGRYQGYFGAVFAFASVIGPLVGGFLVDQASWRWVFYVNLPLGAVALLVVNRVLHLDEVYRKSKVDGIGAALIVGGVSLFLVAVQQAGAAAKIDSTSLAFGFIGVVLIVAFVWWESKAPEPIIPLALFRNAIFSVANVISLISGSVAFGALVFFPLYFQTVRGLSPTMAGFHMLPMLAGMLSMSIISGRLVSRLGKYKWSIVTGHVLVTIGLILLSYLQVATNAWIVALMMLVVGMGMGMFMQMLVLVVQNSVPPEHMGIGTGAVTFFRTLGGAIGAAVLGAIMVLQEKTGAAHYERLYHSKGTIYAFTHALDHAFLYSAIVAMVSLGMTLFLRNQKLRTTSAAPSDRSLEMHGTAKPIEAAAII